MRPSEGYRHARIREVRGGSNSNSGSSTGNSGGVGGDHSSLPAASRSVGSSTSSNSSSSLVGPSNLAEALNSRGAAAAKVDSRTQGQMQAFLAHVDAKKRASPNAAATEIGKRVGGLEAASAARTVGPADWPSLIDDLSSWGSSVPQDAISARLEECLSVQYPSGIVKVEKSTFVELVAELIELRRKMTRKGDINSRKSGRASLRSSAFRLSRRSSKHSTIKSGDMSLSEEDVQVFDDDIETAERIEPWPGLDDKTAILSNINELSAFAERPRSSLRGVMSGDENLALRVGPLDMLDENLSPSDDSSGMRRSTGTTPYMSSGNLTELDARAGLDYSIVRSPRRRHSGNFADFTGELPHLNQRVNASGHTRLHRAAALGEVDEVFTLLGFGIDLTAEDAAGDTALDLAMCYRRCEVVMLLLQHTPLQDLTRQIKIDNDQRGPLLHVLRKLDYHQAVSDILDRVEEAEPNIVRKLCTTTDGSSRISVLAAYCSQAASTCEPLLRREIVEKLLNVGCDPSDDRGQKRDSPLHLAAGSGFPDICELLLAHQANLAARNSFDRTPLHLAALYGFEKPCVVLLDHGAEVNACDSQGQTALHYASARNHTEVCANLLFRGADGTKRDSNGKIPSELTNNIHLSELLAKYNPREMSVRAPVLQLGGDGLIYDEINGVCGAGAFSTVYVGSLRGTTVAFKKINLDAMANCHGKKHREKREAIQNAFEREVGLLYGIRHPNVVSVMGRVEHPLGVVTEYVPNRSVRDMLRHNAQGIPLHVRIGLCISVARAMAWLHALDPPILHCDLHGGNVLSVDGLADTSFGHGKVSDLGFSQIYTAARRERRFNKRISPPEVVLDHGPQTPACDVFAFGIFITEILSREIMSATSESCVIPNTIGACELIVDGRMLATHPELARRIPRNLIESRPKSVQALCDIAADCLRELPSLRPSFREVLRCLESIRVNNPDKVVRDSESVYDNDDDDDDDDDDLFGTPPIKEDPEISRLRAENASLRAELDVLRRVE